MEQIKRRIEAFFAWKDAEGVTNREKIARNQRVIRRVATTDKSKSFEASDGRASGVVLQDGKLIGFGIHIFNEDIYPLQSFEIYYRNCGLAGPLDLSGCGDLLFVDLYHNAIEAVDVAGCEKLRILGLQNNAISAPDADAAFLGWFDENGLCSAEPVWQDEYGSSRVLTARFVGKESSIWYDLS